MKKSILLVLFFVAQVCAGQNLVPNPSFEDTVACPHNANQVDKALGWHSSRNSPDYFNGCDWVNGASWVPQNFVGYQYAHIGNAYCGFIPYDRIGVNYRESFTCQLLTPLTVGAKYNVTFFVSWAGTIGIGAGGLIGCNKIGLLFSTINYSALNLTPLDLPASCQFFTDSIITDSLNWVMVQGNFIADSNYQYMSVGRFTADSLTDTVYVSGGVSAVYYYIDDISVIEDTTTDIEVIEKEGVFKIYPNPTKERVRIFCNHNLVESVSLITISGQLMEASIVRDKATIILDVSRFDSGVYYLKIKQKNKIPIYYKLLKL